MYHRRKRDLLVLLVHPGGPFWQRHDLGAWSIPKGEYGPDEEPQSVALREFAEELGVRPSGEPHFLGEVIQAGGKHVMAYAMEGGLDCNSIHSNTFELEWPPRSGRRRRFPEVDRAGWFPVPLAREKILRTQLPLLDLLEEMVAGNRRALSLGRGKPWR